MSVLVSIVVALVDSNVRAVAAVLVCCFYGHGWCCTCIIYLVGYQVLCSRNKARLLVVRFCGVSLVGAFII